MKLAAVLLLITFSFSACNKIIEYYKPTSNETNTSCRIASYTYDYYGSIVTTIFEYDNNGNPVRITYNDEWLPNGSSNELFIYDDLGRLTHHIPDPFIGDRRQYVYEGSIMVPARDTAEDSNGNRYVETFRFDSAERIIELHITWLSGPEGDPLPKPEVFRYYYDARGNRQANPFDLPWHKTIQYSSKPSLYSLHPTWQLVFRDYSRNTASKVKAYNEHGLPVSFIQSELDYWQPFFDLSQNAVIKYACGNKE